MATKIRQNSPSRTRQHPLQSSSLASLYIPQKRFTTPSVAVLRTRHSLMVPFEASDLVTARALRINCVHLPTRSSTSSSLSRRVVIRTSTTSTASHHRCHTIYRWRRCTRLSVLRMYTSIVPDMPSSMTISHRHNSTTHLRARLSKTSILPVR